MDEHRLLADKRVLVVEDEMLVLMAIEDMLSDLGCTSITVAGNLAKALDLDVDSRALDLEPQVRCRIDDTACRAQREAVGVFSNRHGWSGLHRRRHAGRNPSEGEGSEKKKSREGRPAPLSLSPTEVEAPLSSLCSPDARSIRPT